MRDYRGVMEIRLQNVAKNITGVARGGQPIIVSFWLLVAIILLIQTSVSVFLINSICLNLFSVYLTRQRMRNHSQFNRKPTEAEQPHFCDVLS